MPKKRDVPLAYLTIEELIKSPLGQLAISSGIKEEAIKNTVKPGVKGLYFAAQLNRDFNLMLEPIKTRPNSYQERFDSGRTKPMSEDDPEYLFDLAKIPGRTAQMETLDTMLLLYTENLKNFIKTSRELFGIPSKGLNSNDDRVVHFKVLSNKLKKSGFDIGYKTPNLALAVLLKFINLYLKNKTALGNGQSNRASSAVMMIFDFITLNNPFFSLINGGDRPKPTTPTRFALPLSPKRFTSDSVELTFLIYPTTSRDELKKLIEREWPKVKYMRNKLPKINERKRLKVVDYKKMFQVYAAYRNGDSYSKISADYKVGEARARRIVSDMKKRANEISAFL